MAKLTLGEELVSQEHEFIHNNLHRLIKRNYIKVTHQDGGVCFLEPKDLPDMIEGADSYKTEEVQMTEAEFNALPEFKGQAGKSSDHL